MGARSKRPALKGPLGLRLAAWRALRPFQNAAGCAAKAEAPQTRWDAIAAGMVAGVCDAVAAKDAKSAVRCF